MKNIRLRKGAVLLQTMVICLLLAYVSISVTKWVLQRYTGVVKTYQGNMAMGTAGGGADKVLSGWTFSTSGGSTSATLAIDAKQLTYTRDPITSAASGGVFVFKFKYDTEQPQ